VAILFAILLLFGLGFGFFAMGTGSSDSGSGSVGPTGSIIATVQAPPPTTTSR
jgi:hypothetical protein